MTKLFWTLGLALAVVVASGCGVEVIDADGGTGGTGAGTTTNTGGNSVCSAFDDQDGLGAVTVVFRNESEKPIYLPTSCGTVHYDLTSTSGPDDEVSYVFDGSCLQTCEQLQTEEQFYCGICASTTYVIPVGGTHEVTWGGIGLAWGTEMPAQCWSSLDQADSCGQKVAAPADNYVINITGYDSCGENCECDPNSNQCWGDPTGLEAYADTTTFDYPGANTVEVVFGTCAFGCGDG